MPQPRNVSYYKMVMESKTEIVQSLHAKRVSEHSHRIVIAFSYSSYVCFSKLSVTHPLLFDMWILCISLLFLTKIVNSVRLEVHRFIVCTCVCFPFLVLFFFRFTKIVHENSQFVFIAYFRRFHRNNRTFFGQRLVFQKKLWLMFGADTLHMRIAYMYKHTHSQCRGWGCRVRWLCAIMLTLPYNMYYM